MRDVIVKPEYWTDPRLIDCSLGAQRLYLGLYGLHQGGRCICTPKSLRAVIFAGNSKITEADIDEFLGELSSRGLVDLLSNVVVIVDEHDRYTKRRQELDEMRTAGNG